MRGRQVPDPGLIRTAPCLPLLPTTPARMTHDYVRNGTTSLFAAFETGSGSVIAHPRFHLRCTPTSSSWINLVEAVVRRADQQKSCAAPRTAASPDSKPTSASGSAHGTPTRSRSSVGPRPPTKSSTPSPPTADESTNHDTSVRHVCETRAA